MNRGLKIVIQLLLAAIVVLIIQLLFHPFSLKEEEAPPLPLINSAIPPEEMPVENKPVAAPELPEKTVQEMNAELRQEIARKRQKAEALEARKHEAFMSWWQIPQWCLDGDNMKKLVQCSELKRVKRAEFDTLLSEGKITLPPIQDTVPAAP